MSNCLKMSNGFTLIELVIVVVILGIIGVVAIPRMYDLIEGSKIQSTKDEMMKLKSAINGEDGYKATVGAPPDKLEDLVFQPDGVPTYSMFTDVGWNGPYIDADTTRSLYDAWGRKYEFTATTIKSLGSDVGDPDDDITLLY